MSCIGVGASTTSTPQVKVLECILSAPITAANFAPKMPVLRSAFPGGFTENVITVISFSSICVIILDLTSVCVEVDSTIFPQIEALKLETVICVTGKIAARDGETKNPDLPTGEVELRIDNCEVLGTTEQFRWRSIAIVITARRRVYVIDFSICVARKSTEI